MTTSDPAQTENPSRPPVVVPPFNVLKQCKYGPVLYNKNDMYVGRSFELYGEFSDGETALFRQLVRPGDVIVDIGANIGAHTVPLAQMVGPTGAVVAFEPQRIVYQTLCANVALNNLVNVVCHHAACGEQSGMIQVPMLDPTAVNNFGGLEINHKHPGEPVAVVRLDAVGIARCRLMKVDVEGMELDVLKGATGLIAQRKPALYVENDRQDKSADLIRFIDSLGYAMWWHNPPLYSPDNFFKNPENVFKNIVSINMLCLPKETKANLTGFQPVELPKS
jgi:FkbM family methyltransferase